MTTTRIATVVNGSLQFDPPLELPDQSRVTVTVMSINDETNRLRRREAVRKFFESVKEVGFNSGGDRPTRDQLHDRH